MSNKPEGYHVRPDQTYGLWVRRPSAGGLVLTRTGGPDDKPWYKTNKQPGNPIHRSNCALLPAAAIDDNGNAHAVIDGTSHDGIVADQPPDNFC